MRCALFLFAICAGTALAQAPAGGGMEVVLLGTGFPRPFPDRAGPATAVVVNGKYFVVDAGRGVVLRLAAVQAPLPPVTAVLLTHLHSDHISGLPDLFNTGWVMGRKQPLELYGPRGSDALVAGIMKFYKEDIHIRRDLTETLAPAGARINLHIVREGVVYKDADVTITAFAVDHKPVEYAFGYKFEAGGKTIVISGDTGPSDNLVKFARGADILVHEVYLPGFFRTHATPTAPGFIDAVHTAAAAERLSRYHTDAEQVGKIAAQAGVKQLVLTHVIPPEQSEQIRALAAKSFTGTIVVGNDLMRFRP